VNDKNIVERRSVKLGVQADNGRVIEEGISDQDGVIMTRLLHAILGNTVNPVRKPFTKAEGNGGVSSAQTENGKAAP
jgi:hypothetical protein